MEMRGRAQSNIYLELLVGQIIVIVICLFYINRVYNINIYPDKRAKETFVQTDCYLADKKLSEKGRLLHRYRADFLINYRVNDTTLSRWVSGNGLDYAFSRDLVAQQAILSQYNIGIYYPCWYDPEKPDVAMLVMRHSWMSTMPLILPVLVGLITFIYMLKNIFLILAWLFKSKT